MDSLSDFILLKLYLSILLFSWKTLNTGIPMKDNLVSLGLISTDSLLCPSGCGKKKLLIIHIFMESTFFDIIWSSILHWLGIFCVQPLYVCFHTLKFGGSHLYRKDIRHFL